MSKPKTYIYPDYPFTVNAGQDDEFDIYVSITFTATGDSPDYFDKGMGCWYPGDPAELEIASVEFSDADKKTYPPEQLAILSDEIAEYASANDADTFFAWAGEDDAAERDEAMEARAQARKDDAACGWEF